MDLEKAAISPLQDYALASAGEDRGVVLVSVLHGRFAATPVRGVRALPDQIVLSAAGQAAALYYKDRNQIQVLSGLPGAPKVSIELLLSAGSSPSALAVGDDAHTVLAGVGTTVYLVTPSGEAPILTDLGSIAALTLDSSLTALVADGVRNQIHRVRDVTGAAAADIVAGKAQGISSPVGVAISPDGHRAFIANAKSGAIAIVDLHGGAPVEKISCACKLTGLDRLAGDGVFRLTGLSDKAMWVLEAGARAPRVVFVPPSHGRSIEQ